MVEKLVKLKFPTAAATATFLRNLVAVLVVGLTVLGVILFNEVHHQTTINAHNAVVAKQAAEQAVAKATQVQRKSGVATCQALVALDNVKNGIVFSAPTSSGTAELYVIRYTQALHNLVVATGCEK